MADQHGNGHVAVTGRSQVLTVTLERLRQLKGQKTDAVNVTIKLEFGDRQLGETAKIDCLADRDTEINYSSTLNIASDDPLALDDVVNKPIICTLFEVLPREKKKEEKSVILGQCTIDLLPMFSSELTQKLTVPICSVPGSPLESLSPEQPKPELDVALTLNEQLFSDSQTEVGNIASITVGSLFSPPESWTMSNATGFTYIAATTLPISTDKENMAVFAGGQLKPGQDKEQPNRRRKWALPGNAQGNAVFMGDRTISSDPVDDESGELKGKEDQDFRQTSEMTKLRVTWNIERRCYLDTAGVKNLREKIAKYRYMPIEVFRAVSGGGQGAKRKDDEPPSFHGVAYVDMSPLIYPGVRRISGAYRVVAFNVHDMDVKTGHGFSIMDDATRIATSILNRNSSPGPRGPTKAATATGAADPGKQQAKAAKSSSVMKVSGGLADEPAQLNPDDIQYNESSSFLMVEICLDRPLVRKRQFDELQRQIAEYVPPRPMFPRRTNCAEKAVEEYHSQVANVAAKILEEFREQFGDSSVTGFCHPSTQASTLEDKRQQLVYHLNTSGKYVAFKEQLKYSVVKIVREKYLRTTNFCDSNELQAFLTELYVYLVDEMHVALNKVLSIEDQAPIPPPITDSAQLKHFAREAEVNGNCQLAARFYQERITRWKNDPDVWLDYGTFNLFINDLTKAEECFKECVAIDQRHLHGLLLNGVVCTMQDKKEAAEVFFESASTFYPFSILAWTMFGLFYDAVGNEIGAEMTLNEAHKLNMAAAVAVAKAAAEEAHRQSQTENASEDNKETTTVPAVLVADDTSKTPPAGGNDESQLASPSTQPSRQQSAASHKQPGKTKPTPSTGKSKDHTSVATAAPVVEDIPSPEPTVVPSETIFMQIVDFLLDVKAMPFTERALAHHLLDPLGGATARYHIALAMLRIQRQEMVSAETEVQAALQIEYENPDAWAILGHIKYLCGDNETAKSCYERTLSFVADASEMHSIYLRLASIYLQESSFQKARDTFLLASRRSPSCVSWLGVGMSCYRLGELCDAEAALVEANILNNLDPEVWAYLCLICLQTGRQVEAEQAYKYTIKLNLQDEELLAEITDLQQKVGFGNPQF